MSGSCCQEKMYFGMGHYGIVLALYRVDGFLRLLQCTRQRTPLPQVVELVRVQGLRLLSTGGNKIYHEGNATTLINVLGTCKG